jgi:ADP-heptose:LPS heptosyltransferase
LALNLRVLTPEILLSEEEKIVVDKIRHTLSPDGKRIIGINSTSGNSAPNMPPDEYRRLLDLLKNKNEFVLAVTDYDPPAVMDNLEDVHYICKGRR